MARPEVNASLSKEFVELKIDTARMTGGKELYESQLAAAGVKPGGIPWIVFLDAAGTQLATGNAAAGNIGCPYTDEEIAHFVTMLEKVRRNLTPADIATLRESLASVRKEDEARKQKARAPDA
jgi:hypothetical protein